jgi:hypothetical protein
MTVPTAEQLTRLRQRPHRTKLSLAVYQPNTVLAAQINMASIARGEREITIDVLAGDVWSVTRGMTCYIGTTPGARDRRIRAISCNATTLTIAENDITMIDGWYLTVVNLFEPWAVFPRITLSADNVPSFFKDYDIPYTNQNEQFDPVVALGPCAAKFLESTPTGSFARVWYTSSGTYDPSDGSIPTGTQWFFEGGYPTGSVEADPGYIDYTGGGHFTTTFRVTSNFGKTFEGKRHIMILNEVGDGVFPPISHWGFTSMDGARDNGGYSIRLWIREEADYNKIADGALVVIFSDDSEGAFEGKAGGNAENRSETFFVGYVENDSISINSITNRLEFRAESITGVLKKMATFSATLEDVADAATWNEMTTLTTDKALVHYLRWHTTVLTIADYAPMGNSDVVQFIDFERGNIYDSLNNIAASTHIATVVADRQGKIWTEIDTNVLQTGSTRNLNEVMELTRQDWRGNLDIQVVHDDVLSYLEMGGIAYSGVSATGTSDPFIGGAPGDAPSYYGGLERVSGLVLKSQTHVNELVGLAWARANSDYPELTIPMAGDYRVFDIAPQERVLVTLEEEDTFRGITWDMKPFIPHAIRYFYNSAIQSLQMEMLAHEETEGPPGETVDIPVDPPFDTFDLPSWELPNFILPPLPVIPPLEPPPVTGDTVYYAYGTKIARCRNFMSGVTPNWSTAMDVSAVSGISSIYGMVLDPSDPINTALVWGINGSTNPCIFRTTNLDAASPTWTEVFGATEAASVLCGSGVVQRQIQHIRPWINGRLWTFTATHPAGTCGCNVGINCPTTVRSLDGITWGPSADIVVPSVSYGTPFTITPTTWAGGVAFAGGQFRVWKTIDTGANWSLVFIDTPQFTVPVSLPHLGNSNAQIHYIMYETVVSDTWRLYETEDGGSVYSLVPFTYAGSSKWGPKVTSSVIGDRSMNFHVHPISGIGYGNFIAPPLNYSIFVTLTAAGLVFRYKFTDEFDIYSLHEGDDSLHYMAGPGTVDPYIVGSDDSGLTWYDREGDIESTVDTFANLGTIVSICPVGVV